MFVGQRGLQTGTRGHIFSQIFDVCQTSNISEPLLKYFIDLCQLYDNKFRYHRVTRTSTDLYHAIVICLKF